jgi:NSS family neurotransmitter:Na+ symporter
VEKRDGFASKFGVIAAAAGSAIGLGNIWRFPYVAGENGGAAFILIYLLFVVLIGVPVMLSEFTIGRRAQRNPIGAFSKLRPGSQWKWVGVMGVLVAFMILAFYSTIAGWTMHYVYLAITNTFAGKDKEALTTIFNTFKSSTFMPVFWQIVFMALTALIVLAGVEKGIEKYAKILMPLLFVIIIILDIRAVTLPGSGEGLSFLFKPDFSKITSSTVLEALGQAFFSLSIGMGVLITYGSYMPKNNNLSNVAFEVSFFDTLIAILAGIAIFPAVFAFNIQPNAGPELVFLTLPVIFQSMPGGYLFAVLFFLLLLVAALTSSISVLEVVVAYYVEEKNMNRKKASIIATILITILGVFATLSFGPLANFKILSKTVFDLLDFTSANIMLPLGGFFIVIFLGWVLPKKDVVEEISNDGKLKIKLFGTFYFIIRYIAPIAIGLIFLNGLGVLNL